MTRSAKIAVIAGVAVLVGLAFALKRGPTPSARKAPADETPSPPTALSSDALKRGPTPSTPNAPADGAPAPPTVVTSERRVPRLVDLGATECIPCKMMAPILEELKTEYAGRLQVDFYDVWEDPRPAREFRISVIPTQVFLDPDGRELFRHEGFMSKPDILGMWKRLGYDFHGAK